jgi:phosphopantothenoylcysteine decarboxylase / phosphopantothenate---cysteine ligase
MNAALKLQGRRILLGVTGGIAAYKAADLVRRLKEAGAEVRVLMTAHAREFVTPMTFQALSGEAVREALFDPAHEAAMGHIELARWPELMLVAPCSANTLAKLALGLADDLLSTCALATDRPLAVAPAMNRLMWAHPATQAHVTTLRQRGVAILGPGAGDQACGETGDGRLLEPAQIRDAVLSLLASPVAGPLAGRRVVITAGPTREAIDPVRFISNRSSGKQGFALATSLRAPGAPISSSDYRMAEVAADKIKKTGERLQLELVRNPDILAEIRAAQPELFLVGFAAETQALAEHARDKLQRKGLQMIAANWVGDGRAFEVDVNAVKLLWADGEADLGPSPKTEIADRLAALIAEHYARQRPR